MTKDTGASSGDQTRRRQRKPKTEDFLLEVVDWKVRYLFVADRDAPVASGAEFRFEEHKTIEVSARIIAPERFAGRTMAIELSDLAVLDRTLGRGSDAHATKPLGTLSLRGERNGMRVHMPTSTIWGLIATLAAGKLPFIEVEGEQVGQGAYQVTMLQLGPDYEPGDYGLS